MSSSIISWLGLGVALISLILHFRNRKVVLRSYWLNRSNHRSSSIDFVYVNSKQKDDEYILKLVLFNPGSIASVIKSLTIYREIVSSNAFLRFFNISEWEEVTEAKWWPTKNDSCSEIKSFAEEYKNLYVDDLRDILVSMPGYIDRNRYKFHIKTNNGGYVCESRIDSISSCFPYASEQWHSEK